MAIFRALWNKHQRVGHNTKTKEGHDFLRKAAGKLYSKKNHAQRFIASNSEQLKSRLSIGKMYLFTYDAKHKETLPYWDMFPLIFPIELYNDGFLGINFHYLPPAMRAVLMDALYSLTNNKKYDETTKLKISYQILKGVTKYRYFEPCVKRYLYSQLRSRYLLIPPEEWEMALFIPLQKFQKQTSRKVWQDSRDKIHGIRRR